LLAFTKQSNEPVGLIQQNSTTYIIKKSCKGTQCIVNNEIAESLEPIGYMFSDLMLKWILLKVLGFAMNGVRKDKLIRLLLYLESNWFINPSIIRDDI
jgi:ATP-binding cassette subfamily C protein